MIALWILFGFYFTWAFYLSMMPLERAYKSGYLTNVSKVFGIPLVIAFLICDSLFNFVYGSILFAERPHELLFTKRLDRHISSDPKSRRYKIAMWFCSELLDPFDPDGFHCKKKKK